jgi:GNAT superfamily N-acetyltransferase
MAAVKAADVLIRVAGPGEFAVIGELTVAAYADGGALSLGAADPYADVLRDAASRPPETTVFLATDPAGAADSADPGRALGAVTYIPPGSPMAQVAHGQEAEIRMLAVAPDRRGRGPGTPRGSAGARALRDLDERRRPRPLRAPRLRPHPRPRPLTRPHDRAARLPPATVLTSPPGGGVTRSLSDVSYSYDSDSTAGGSVGQLDGARAP